MYSIFGHINLVFEFFLSDKVSVCFSLHLVAVQHLRQTRVEGLRPEDSPLRAAATQVCATLCLGAAVLCANEENQPRKYKL